MWKERRDTIFNGLRQLVRILGKAMEDIAAAPGLLDLPSSAERIPGSSCANIYEDKVRKLAGAAMERAGVSRVSGRYGEPLSGRWKNLLGKIEEDRVRLGVSALTGFVDSCPFHVVGRAVILPADLGGQVGEDHRPGSRSRPAARAADKAFDIRAG